MIEKAQNQKMNYKKVRNVKTEAVSSIFFNQTGRFSGYYEVGKNVL